MKVIPLLGAGALGRGVLLGNSNYPDCSSVDEVVREIEITKRLAQLYGGGYVEFIKCVHLPPIPPRIIDVWLLVPGADKP